MLCGRRADPLSLAQIEEEIAKEGTCYLKEYVHDKKLTPESFFIKYQELEREHHTYSANTNELETMRRRFARSLIDTYRTIKYYYPEFTFRDMLLLCRKYKNHGTLVGHFCGNIYRTCISLKNSKSGWGLLLDQNQNEFGYNGLTHMLDTLLQK